VDDVNLLRQLVAWWRGSADPTERREADEIRDRMKRDRAEAAFGAGQTNKTGG
jgi:hypothetical protein